MISARDVELIHDRLITEFGGAPGIRDKGALEAAVQRPFQTFDGNELYPTAAEKAAAVFESLVKNHPFIDGNKRIAYVMMRMTLLLEGLDVSATEDEKYDFVIQAASGKLAVHDIRSWILAHLHRTQ